MINQAHCSNRLDASFHMMSLVNHESKNFLYPILGILVFSESTKSPAVRSCGCGLPRLAEKDTRAREHTVWHMIEALFCLMAPHYGARGVLSAQDDGIMRLA